MIIPEGALLFIAGFGILQAFMLSGILFFHPRGEKTVNLFLSIYIIVLSMPMFAPLVLHLTSWHAVSFIEPMILLIGPMLYLYIRSFKEAITWKKAWPHMVLYFAATAVGTYMFFDVRERFPNTTAPPEEVVYGPIMLIRAAVRIGQLVVYYFLARKELLSYQRSIQHLYSETSRINMSWVRWLINGYIMLVVIMIVIFIFILRSPEDFKLLILLNTAIVSPYIYVITYKGLTQPTAWQLRPGETREKIQEELHVAEVIESNTHLVKPKSQKFGLSQTKIDEIITSTIRLMEQDKIYQETELSLQELADRLKFPPYQVSQAINEGMKKSFYDLVNGYRVEEAKRLLLDPNNQHYKVLSVGFESGFNSKTTFNTVFKKFTGVSPSEFRDRHLTSASLN